MSETERREVPASAGIVKCPNCGAKVHDNPEKHQHRDKICNNCKQPYKRVGLHLPSFNISWIREKLERKQSAEDTEMQKFRGRAKKILLDEFVDKNISRLPTQDEIETKARQLYQEEKLFHKQQQLRAKGRL